MKAEMPLQAILAQVDGKPSDRLAVFAVLCLGVIDSLAAGLLTASDAVRTFFHSANCMFVRKQLRNKRADEIMGRGTQLPDLFEALPVEEAQREFHHELAAMRLLCQKLLEQRRSVA